MGETIKPMPTAWVKVMPQSYRQPQRGETTKPRPTAWV